MISTLDAELLESNGCGFTQDVCDPNPFSEGELCVAFDSGSFGCRLICEAFFSRTGGERALSSLASHFTRRACWKETKVEISQTCTIAGLSLSHPFTPGPSCVGLTVQVVSSEAHLAELLELLIRNYISYCTTSGCCWFACCCSLAVVRRSPHTKPKRFSQPWQLLLIFPLLLAATAFYKERIFLIVKCTMTS